MMRLLLRVTAVSTLLVMGGCLSNVYTIPRKELRRLAAESTSLRHGHVRVLQELGRDDPTDRGPDPHVGVAVDVPILVTGTHRPTRRRVINRGTGGSLRVEGGSSSTSGVGGSGGGGGGGGCGKGCVFLAVLAVAVAGATTIALAATEGARFDGWADVRAEQPIYLSGPDGELAVVPLSQLVPDDADWAREAFVWSGDRGLTLRERAPLNRRGWTSIFDVGATSVNADGGDRGAVFAARFAAGGFPVQHLGFLGGFGIDMGTNGRGDQVLQLRPYVEVKAFLPIPGRLHIGAYASLGYSFGVLVSGDYAPPSAGLVSGGGVLELELTTRLALTLRGGVVDYFGEASMPVGFEMVGGVAVY